MRPSSVVVATVLASALAASPVLAQSSGTANNPRPSGAASSPNATGTNSSATQTSGASNSNVRFWTENGSSNEWRTSKLKGLSVYNANNEKLGDIDDILLDKSGQVKAVVIGVGGFLGLGEHNVAVPFDQLQFVYNSENRNTAGLNAPPAGTTNNTMSTQARDGVGNPSTNAAANTGLGNPAATTPATSGTRPATTASAPGNRNSWAPDRAILNATKDELKNAPQFKYNG